MALRNFTLFLVCLMGIACTTQQKPAALHTKKPEILYILPDGTMEFKGRRINEKDVVVYEDGRGGERAAIKLIIPLHPDVYRDTIIVERVEVDVPVTRK